jgi:gliding motility-associated-like protein
VMLQQDSITIDVQTPVVTAAPADTTVCAGDPIPFRVDVTPGYTYSWSPATGLSDSTLAEPVVYLSGRGSTTTYTVSGTTTRGCTATATVTVSIYPGTLAIMSDTLICHGDPAQLYASGGVTYSWSPSAFLNDPSSPAPVASIDTTTLFNLSSTDAFQCTEQGAVTVRVKPIPVFHAPPDETVCYGFGIALKSDNPSGYVYNWSPATALNDVSFPVPIASPDADIVYTLHISDSLCTAYDSTFGVAVTVIPSPVVKAQKDNDIDCAIHMAQLSASGAVAYNWTPVPGLSDPTLPNPVATIDSTTTYIVKGTGSNGCYAFDTLTVKVTATGANTFVVPNAFTPNGDGHNDRWGVVRWGDVQLRQMDIYDRFGMCVFTTRSPSDSWDGTFKGVLQPTGGYVYVIRAHTFCGDVTRTGVVMLIR